MAEVNLSRIKAHLTSHLCTQLPVPTKSFTGQTIIITGSNTGMGLKAARHLVRLDAARVILAVRSTTKGEAAAASIRASFPGRSSSDLETVVQVWALDLASYASVQAFAARAATELDRLDAVVCNAGMYVYKSGFSLAEGQEVTITVNVVSTLLLGVLLLPKLRETSVRYDKEVVLTFTGSFVHLMTNFPERRNENIFEALADEKMARMPDRLVLLPFFPPIPIVMRFDSNKIQIQRLQDDGVAPGPRACRPDHQIIQARPHNSLHCQPRLRKDRYNERWHQAFPYPLRIPRRRSGQDSRGRGSGPRQCGRRR